MVGIPAHPRACGENHAPSLGVRGAPGSSPRVRGKLEVGLLGGGGLGLIPARAGKTTASVRAAARTWAHPRACGENFPAAAPVTRASGSSPRVRGKRAAGRRRGCAGRLIPARAGKTSRSRGSGCPGSAHPRACGENWANAGKTVPFEGSSPRVRGKPCRCRAPGGVLGSSPRVRGKLPNPNRRRHLHGLIPARAGKTSSRASSPPSVWAHPRACGENRAPSGARCRCRGSSPRVRGKRRPLRPGDVVARLIPARAGKTPISCPLIEAQRAHPRACGENATPANRSVDANGSSPRVRGKLGAHRHSPRRGRLIPARAGKTAAARCTRACGGAHPRACGENPGVNGTVTTYKGSSPRVRGKRRGTDPDQ